eukprot:288242_1
MATDQTTSPMIYYALIAFNSKIICEVNDTKDGQEGKHSKYIRASKKILKKIEQYEIRRPDGMGTLISGTYSYNYIHGYEYTIQNTHYPLLESLIFLCVLPLYQTNSNVTPNERHVAFNFLSSVRKDFLTSFTDNLQYIYNHHDIHKLSIRIAPNTDLHNHTDDLTSEEEDISNGLRALSTVMRHRMCGDYDIPFEYHSSNGNTLQEAGEMDALGADDSFINISIDPTDNIVNDATDDTNNNISMGNGPGYGTMAIDDAHTQPLKKPRISTGLTIADIRQTMKEKIGEWNTSVTSLRSMGTPFSDKFVDYETMPLIGSTTSLLGSEYVSNYRDSPTGCLQRHRPKIAISLAIMLIIYLVVVMFCGWDFAHCNSH